MKRKKFIWVNNIPRPWTEGTITYSQLVNLAVPPPPKNTIILAIFTVQYSHGPKENPNGTLVRGQTVKVKSCMAFDVTRT